MVIVSSILKFLRQKRDYRATRTQLHNLDDHMLWDIGVRRDQIDSLILEQREISRPQTAADTRDRRNRRGSRPAPGGQGLAAQH